MSPKEPRCVPRLLVEAVHLDQLREHGGLIGLRDENALESALARPRQRLAYSPQADLAELAAAYAFGLSSNHPFRDGNKRIAFLTSLIFLGLNGMTFEASDQDVVKGMLALAAGERREQEMAKWLRSNMRPTDENL